MGVGTGTDGVLVLRLWIEPDQRMRVRITRATDLGPTERTTYAASKAEVLLVVDEWLDEFVPGPGDEHRS
jgi:hypothetical protein